MKMPNKNLIAVLAVMITLGLTGPTATQAATAPNLGVATGYSVFGVAGVTETAGQTSHLWGDVGGNAFGVANLIASQVSGTLYNVTQTTVVNAISSAYGDLAGETQTGAISLAASPSVGPGVYNVAATAFNSTLTLSGAGVYIFRSTSSIAQTTGGTMSLTNGATACNVYWQIPTSMTFGAIGNIEGTIITNTGNITFVSGVPLKGRAWAHTQVTMDNNQITEPTCASATVAASGDNDNRGGGDNGNGSRKHKSVPKLPNAGIAPEEKNVSWNIIALAGILMLTSITTLAAVLKKRAM
ncbi:MAG: ice-binding family protein [Candidatus Moraniibacteriota bacterium]